MRSSRGTRRRGVGLVGGILTVAGLVALALTAPAEANHDNQEVEGPVPPEVIEKFQDCPLLPGGVPGFLCLNVRAHDGDLKLGSVQANVDDPIAISVAIGLDGTDPVIETGGGEGGVGGEDPLAPILDRFGACDEGVRISGGILGAPELDPVLENDPLGALCLSASPQVGSPIVEDAFGFLGYLVGSPEPVTLGVPLSIKLNNLVFGEKCQIGTAKSPFVINLTNGTTSPPEGVEPISGETGPHTVTNYDDPELGTMTHATVTDSLFVDNAFKVPGATKCDILLGDLLDQDQGLFDSTINDMVGLPSAAGQNHAKFRLDTEFVFYPAVHHTTIAAAPEALDFGEVAVGQSSEPQTVTVENTGDSPDTVGTRLLFGADEGDYQVDAGSCADRVLEPGDTCEVEVRFSPTRAEAVSGQLRVQASGRSQAEVALEGTGVGEPPLAPDPATLDFGVAYVTQSPTPSQTVAFENASAQPVTVGQGASLGEPDSAWTIEDGCAGETLAPGERCTVDVTLVPGSTGNKDVTLEIRGDGGAFLGSASLEGSVEYPLGAPRTPPSGFVEVTVGEQSDVHTVTFTNNSPEAVEITEPATVNFDETSWQIVDDRCDDQTVPAGGTCEVDVIFAPDSAGFEAPEIELRTTDSQVVGVSESLWGRGIEP